MNTAWRTRGLFGACPTLVGGYHWSLGASTSGDWLWKLFSPRIMPANQLFGLFYPLAGDSIGSALNSGRPQSSGPGRFLGSLSGWLGVRHLLIPVIRLSLRTPRKKERGGRSVAEGTAEETGIGRGLGFAQRGCAWQRIKYWGTDLKCVPLCTYHHVRFAFQARHLRC